MRTGFTDKFLKALMWAQDHGEVTVILIEIDHPDLDEPMRLCNQMKDFESNSLTYKARSLTCSIPNEFGEDVPNFTLTVTNSDFEMGLTCFALSTAETFTIKMMIVVKSDPDNVEFVATFNSSEDAHDEATSVFSATLDFGLNEMLPAHAMTPQSHPGVFGTINT